MQSIGEMPANLLQTLGASHPRPSISGLISAESQEVDDSVVFSVTSSSVVDSSANKSPINASSSKLYYKFSDNFEIENFHIFKCLRCML